jgi:hypothetical protein
MPLFKGKNCLNGKVCVKDTLLHHLHIRLGEINQGHLGGTERRMVRRRGRSNTGMSAWGKTPCSLWKVKFVPKALLRPPAYSPWWTAACPPGLALLRWGRLRRGSGFVCLRRSLGTALLRAKPLFATALPRLRLGQNKKPEWSSEAKCRAKHWTFIEIYLTQGLG